MTTFFLRPFRESDRSILRALTIDSFEGLSIDHAIDEAFGPVAGRDWRWRKARMAEAWFASGDAEAVVAEEESGAILGFVSLRFDREAKVGYIPDLAVAESARNRGIGRRLLERALDRLRAEGMKVARIETLEGNAVGRHLYPTLGFQEVARQVHFAMPLGDEGS